MKNVFCTRRTALVERFYRRFAALTGGFLRQTLIILFYALGRIEL